MAYVRSLLNRSSDDILSIFEEALEYAGGTFAERLKAFRYEWQSGGYYAYGYCGIDVTPDPSTSDYVAAYYAGENAWGRLHARSNTTASAVDIGSTSSDDTLNIVATHSGISVYKSTGATSVATFVIALDNHGQLVTVAAGGTLASPYVLPVNDASLTNIQYPASKSALFGCTSLSYIPVPTFDGQPHYLPELAYANATQYIMNGPVLMGSKIWYCIGGAFYLYEGENDA